MCGVSQAMFHDHCGVKGWLCGDGHSIFLLEEKT